MVPAASRVIMEPTTLQMAMPSFPWLWITLGRDGIGGLAGLRNQHGECIGREDGSR